MMGATKHYGRYSRFIAYIVVVVLANVAGITLFFRADLTSNRIYSLSEASRSAVATLSEPLTINVFFTKSLPAPHNNTERYLRDLLEEYSVQSNRFFNYRFFDVSAKEGDIGEDEKENQEMARNYGIYPVQIQHIEQDEVKFQNAYMGMVLIHGDVVDKIPAITSTEGLEYTITSKIEKMNSKISALLNLAEPVRIKLYFSSSLADVAPQLRMGGLMELPDRLGSLVEELNEKYYGKLAFTRLDPTMDTTLVDEVSKYNILTLRWPSMKDRSGKEILSAGSASTGLVVEKGERFETLSIIRVINLPLFGTQYQLVNLDELEEKLSELIDDVIDINKKIGYLSDHGTLPIVGAPPGPNQQQDQLQTLTNFNTLISRDYSLSQVALKRGEIPEGIDCLIIAGPREVFSDYALFEIDQFLMKGRSLAIFLDSFEEIVMPQDPNRMSRNQGPIYRPINSGLEKLLAHYGTEVVRSYVLDLNCYEQNVPQMFGGGKRALYFAPIIKNEYIDKSYHFMEDVKMLVMVKGSPVTIKGDAMARLGLSGRTLFSSSGQSWETSGRISLNPWEMQPPEDDAGMESKPLAVIIEGEFTSYFKGREIPEKPVEEEPAGDETGDEKEPTPDGEAADEKAEEGSMDAASITGERTFIARGKPGKLFLVGSSEILRNNVIDEQGDAPNGSFAMNLLDYLNGREDYAKMRSKSQRFNPLRETTPAAKTFVKTFNIAGLPVIVVAFGIAVWFRRAARKRAIQAMFKK